MMRLAIKSVAAKAVIDMTKNILEPCCMLCFLAVRVLLLLPDLFCIFMLLCMFMLFFAVFVAVFFFACAIFFLLLIILIMSLA